MAEDPHVPGMDSLESAPAPQPVNTTPTPQQPAVHTPPPHPAYAQQQSPAQVPQPAYPPQTQSAQPAQPTYAVHPQTGSQAAQPTYAQQQTAAQTAQPAYTQQQTAAQAAQPAYAQQQTAAQTAQPAYAQQQTAAQTAQPAYAQQQTAAQTAQPAYAQQQTGAETTRLVSPQPGQNTAEPAYRQYAQTQQMQQSYSGAYKMSPGQKLQYLRNLPPISTAEAERCRHNQEKFWYYLLIVMNFLAILFVLGAVALNMKDYGEDLIEFATVLVEQSEESESDDPRSDRKAEKEREEEIQDFVEDTPVELKALFYGLFMIIIGYCSLYYLNAQVRASSVKITLRNFPEIYSLIESYAWRLGMKQVPDAYIVQQSGVLNAFSAYLFKKQYIEINSEVFEVAYREHQDIDALAFIIAHEMSHIYYGHATLHYNIPIWFSMNFPIVGAIASRSREYSCDRLAQHLTYNDGLEAMFMLMVDRHLYKMVDKQDYLDNAVKETGFFMWLLNFFASHPIMPKRVLALARREGSGDLF